MNKKLILKKTLEKEILIDRDALNFLSLLDGRICQLLLDNFKQDYPFHKIITLKDFNGITFEDIQIVELKSQRAK